MLTIPMKKKLKIIILIAAILFLITALLIFIGMNLSQNEIGPSIGEKIYIAISYVLLSPLITLFGYLPSNYTSFIYPKLIIFIFNSFLWGIIISIINNLFVSYKYKLRARI